jgi:hypothetical protein
VEISLTVALPLPKVCVKTPWPEAAQLGRVHETDPLAVSLNDDEEGALKAMFAFVVVRL